MPYLERAESGIVVRFGAGAYPVAEASTSDDLDLRVQSIAATQDSAIAAIAAIAAAGQDARATLVEVPSDGPSGQAMLTGPS